MDARTHLSCFAEAAAAAVDSGALAGIVGALTTPRETIVESAHGWRDHGRSLPMAADSVLALASMTKAVTAVAVLQLVERGAVGLDDPLGAILPYFAAPQVLDGFGADGAPILRPARGTVTLRHLLTHSSGLANETWSADLLRYKQQTGAPTLATRTNASLEVPLLFDPGARWQYSLGLEWTGKLIEALTGLTFGAYLAEHVTGPLGMADTQFGPLPRQQGRLAGVFQREDDGTLQPSDFALLPGEFESGGGGLYGTARDYLVFLRMLLNRGRHDGIEILRPGTIDLMETEQIPAIAVTRMVTAMPHRSNDFEPAAGLKSGWNLGGVLLREPSPNGRPAGSWGWGGLANCYFWADRVNGLAGMVLSQVLPFGDGEVLGLFGALERDAYGRGVG